MLLPSVGFLAVAGLSFTGDGKACFTGDGSMCFIGDCGTSLLRMVVHVTFAGDGSVNFTGNSMCFTGDGSFVSLTGDGSTSFTGNDSLPDMVVFHWSSYPGGMQSAKAMPVSRVYK